MLSVFDKNFLFLVKNIKKDKFIVKEKTGPQAREQGVSSEENSVGARVGPSGLAEVLR